MSKHGHFTFLLICERIPRMPSFMGRREYVLLNRGTGIFKRNYLLGLHTKTLSLADFTDNNSIGLN